MFPTLSRPLWSAEEGASISIIPVERTAYSAGFVVVRGSVPVGRRSPGAFGFHGKKKVGMRLT
jgi:hypothetical protein